MDLSYFFLQQVRFVPYELLGKYFILKD